MNKRFITVVSKLTHVDPLGKACMVDISNKSSTLRTASASASMWVGRDVLKSIRDNVNKKGDVFTVAKIAGIQACKQTSNIIPLCHPIQINKIDIQFEIEEPERVKISTYVIASDSTGVEMEAMTAASVASLTVYDMIKAITKAATIEYVRLESKSGGKSGDFKRE